MHYNQMLNDVDFKNIYGNLFYKIVKQDLKHHNFQYVLNNINVDENFDTEILGAGLYFTKVDDIWRYLEIGKFICIVEIPDNALVVAEDWSITEREPNFKFRANCLILKDMITISSFIKSHSIAFNNIVKSQGLALEYVESQTQHMCEQAVNNNGLALEFVKSQTHYICESAIKNNGIALKFVKRQTYDMCALAVQNNGLALEFVFVQTKKICLLAVTNNGMALQFVENQTSDICEMAVRQNGASIEFMQQKFITPHLLQIVKSSVLVNKMANCFNVLCEKIYSDCNNEKKMPLVEKQLLNMFTNFLEYTVKSKSCLFQNR